MPTSGMFVLFAVQRRARGAVPHACTGGPAHTLHLAHYIYICIYLCPSNAPQRESRLSTRVSNELA